MRKIALLVFTVILLFASAACSESGKPVRQLERAQGAEDGETDVQSPEGLAKASAVIYQKLSDGSMNVDEAVQNLEPFISRQSAGDYEKYKDAFRKGIADFIAYMRETDDTIVAVEFAKTSTVSDTECSIERIQKHKNGKSYYFKQDFILEDGQWKIAGDNITDPFQLK